MARVLPPRFCSWNNSSHFSSTFHDLPQPQPKICHKLACDLKTLILHGHRIIDGDLLHTTVSDHTYKKEHIHIGMSWNKLQHWKNNLSIIAYFIAFMGLGWFLLILISLVRWQKMILPSRCSPFLLWVHVISCISIWICWILVRWRKINLSFIPSDKCTTSLLFYSQLQKEQYR